LLRDQNKTKRRRATKKVVDRDFGWDI